jgi:hypothetical protein
MMAQNEMISLTDAQQVAELEPLLPVLKAKGEKGLIRPSYHEKARDMIRWQKRGTPFTDKQKAYVGFLTGLAKRQHRGDSSKIEVNSTIVQNVDVNAVAEKVMEKIGGNAKAIIDNAQSEAKKLMASDVEALKAVVLKELETARKVEITIKHADGKVLNLKGAQHKQFQHLVKASNAKLPNGYVPGIFLQGEASSGKTTGAKMLAEALKLKWHFNGAISFPHEMLGFIDGNGKYHRTPFRDAYEHGGVYTFDEVDRSDPVALLSVNPHLANGVATFPDAQIKRHKDCIIICTANTWGLGADANYSGATKLDAAFLSRFPIRINWDIDPALEEAIVHHPEWLKKVRAARYQAQKVGLKVLIDTRVAQAGAALIQAGYSLDEAATMTYLANLKPEQRKQLENVHAY